MIENMEVRVSELSMHMIRCGGRGKASAGRRSTNFNGSVCLGDAGGQKPGRRVCEVVTNGKELRGSASGLG
jgi:hypothetical protein